MSQPGQEYQETEESIDENEESIDDNNELDLNDNNGLKLDNIEDDELDEDEERRKYGLNSPKAKNQPTPNTKFRESANINSPKNKQTLDWSSANKDDDEDSNKDNPLAGMVTQVQRPGKSNDSEIPMSSNPITSVERDDDNTAVLQKQQSSGGLCSCLCNIFTCCSPTSPNETQQHLNNNDQLKQDDDQQTPEPIEDLEEREPSSEEPPSGLLPPPAPELKGKKCLVLDLDETLVHSSFKPISTADFIIPVEIDNVVHKVYVMKRPYVDEFLVQCAKNYEIVIFTASLSKYADPLLDELDKHNTISARLFRESCVLHGTAYVKDLRKIGRKLKDTIIVDNSAQSYLFQPKNAVPILSWFDDKSDTQLRDFQPVLDTTLKNIKDVRNVLDANNKTFKWLCNQANQPLSKFE